jgi:protein TonB
MIHEIECILLSLFLHAVAIVIAITIGGSVTGAPKPIIIDLTLVSPQGSASPGPEGKSEKPGGSSPKLNVGEKPEKIAASKIHKIILKKHKPVEVRRVPAKPEAPRVREIPHTPQLSQKNEPVSPASPTSGVSLPDKETTNGGSGSSLNTSGSGSGTGKGTFTGGGSGSGSGGGGGTGNGKGQSPSGHGTGISTGQLKNRYLEEQFEYIKMLIEKNINYPARARRMGWTGKVVVSFIILENGRVSDMKIVKSSGYELLDDNVMETIRKVQPFPKPPVRAELKIPITYRLDY